MNKPRGHVLCGTNKYIGGFIATLSCCEERKKDAEGTVDVINKEWWVVTTKTKEKAAMSWTVKTVASHDISLFFIIPPTFSNVFKQIAN